MTTLAAAAHDADACLTTTQAQQQVSAYASAHSWIGSPTPSNAITFASTGWFQRYTNQNAVIWISQCDGTGPHITQGLIEAHYEGTMTPGVNNSAFGYPVSDELETRSNDGRVSFFEDGGIFYNPSAGTFGVHGWIWQKYFNMDTTLSGLGYPISDEQAFSASQLSGRRNQMQNGWMVFNPSASPFDWMHATFPIFDVPHPADPNNNVVGYSLGTDETGAVVQVIVNSNFGNNANVDLFVDGWAGRLFLTSGTTSSTGQLAFPALHFDNVEAGGGDANGNIVTLEVVGSAGQFEAIGVHF